MLRIFFLVIAIIFSTQVWAQSKEPQSLEEITAGLKAKKAAMEPFDPKDVKVDVESLGLDDVDKKPAAVVEQETTPPPLPTPELDSKLSVKISESKPAEKESKIKLLNPNPPAPPVVAGQSKQSENPPPLVAPTERIRDMLKKGEEKAKKMLEEAQKTEAAKEVKITAVPVPAPAAPEVKIVAEKAPVVKKTPVKNTQKYVNSAKKRALKKRLEAEKRRKIYEKQRQDNAKKLRELREKYLLKIDQDSLAENESEFLENDEKILPQKKNLNPFISEEPPALPIMTRFRTPDNLHIPMPLTDLERQNILFDSVASGNVAFFNSAYKDIENPNLKNPVGDTILTYSTLLRKYPIMAAVLARGANPRLPNELGYSAADIAIELLDAKALEILLSNKLDVNETDAFGRTYLMHAARVGFLPAVEMLVEKGSDINAMDNDGFTALSIAYRHHKEVIVQFLLKNGAKTWIEKPYNPEKQSLIQELENHWN